jgi:hypothetical protein
MPVQDNEAHEPDIGGSEIIKYVSSFATRRPTEKHTYPIQSAPIAYATEEYGRTPWRQRWLSTSDK